EQIVEALIALLPPEDQTKTIKKEANRREKVRLEGRAAKSKEDELKKQREAFDEEKKRREQRTFEEWRQLVAELEQLLANVSEARPLLQRVLELISGRQENLPGGTAGLLLRKKVDEKPSDFQTSLEKELEKLRHRLIGSLPTEKQVEWRQDSP